MRRGRGTFFVYYLFDQAGGALLYIGRSNQPKGRRWSFERRTGIAAMLGSLMQRFTNFDKACEAELRAIAAHDPPHNQRMHSATGMLGKTPSDDHRAKIGAANKGRRHYPNGRVFSAEHKARISAAKKGVPKSDAHKEKLRANFRNQWTRTAS